MPDRKRVLAEFLIAGAVMGDQTAMSQLVELFGPRLIVHATRLLGDKEEAREAVQEAWIDILRGLRQLKDPQAFLSWAMQIITRRCAKLIRTKQKQRAVAMRFADEVVSQTEPIERTSDEGELVHAAISKLSPEQAATVALFYLEDMRISEVAVALDIPVGTVKTRLMHARARLKEELKGKYHE